MRLAIVVEAIPPYCGGGEQVAWVHATEMASRHAVSVVTFGEVESRATRDGVDVHFLPARKRKLAAYSTLDRSRLNACIDRISPNIIHCHMPQVLSACLRKKDRLIVSTIHDGVPEDELLQLKSLTRAQWLKFKVIRRINVTKSDAVTCVSRFSRDVMRRVYPGQAGKFVFIPNPISERLFTPTGCRDDSFVLNFGRQIPLKVGALLEVARVMPETRFVFVGTGEMVKDYGLANVEFVGFSDSVEQYIDAASLCVFPSLSENFPLVGLEAMARGKPVIATRRGFSEYIRHMKDGYLLDSTEPPSLKQAINLFMSDRALRNSIGAEARRTAEEYRPSPVVRQYEALYQSLFGRAGLELA